MYMNIDVDQITKLANGYHYLYWGTKLACMYINMNIGQITKLANVYRYLYWGSKLANAYQYKYRLDN